MDPAAGVEKKSTLSGRVSVTGVVRKIIFPVVRERAADLNMPVAVTLRVLVPRSRHISTGAGILCCSETGKTRI